MAEIPEQALFSGGPISQQIGLESQPSPNNPANSAPVSSGNTAGNAMSTMEGVNPSLATAIAKAIAVGMVSAPTNDAQWAQLMDQFSTPMERDMLNQKIQQTSNPQHQQQTQQPQGASSAQFANGGSQAQWAATVLQRAGLPTTQNNVDNMMRWMTAEEPTNDWSHANNPLNINASGAGFDSFQSLDQAATRTAQVIRQSNMNGIFTALQGNANPNEFSAAVVASPWAGSHYGGDPNHIAQIAVPQGSGNAILQTPSQSSPSFQGSSSVVGIANQQIGTPYVWGGEDPSSPNHPGAFDCSGLVQWVYGQAGEKLPRVAQAQYDATPKIADGAAIQPGDLLFFGGGPKNISHVGIYIGNGQMIDAPHTGADVRVDQVFTKDGRTLWADYVGATRPADPSGMSTGLPGSNTALAQQRSLTNFGQILNEVTSHLSRLTPRQRTVMENDLGNIMQTLDQQTVQQGQAQ